MEGLNVSSIPVTNPIKLDIAAIGAIDLANGFFILGNHTLEVITWMLLHLIELDAAAQTVFIVFESALS
jgi:hypothetical protein